MVFLELFLLVKMVAQEVEVVVNHLVSGVPILDKEMMVVMELVHLAKVAEVEALVLLVHLPIQDLLDLKVVMV
jgi:hypothetical protein